MRSLTFLALPLLLTLGGCPQPAAPPGGGGGGGGGLPEGIFSGRLMSTVRIFVDDVQVDQLQTNTSVTETISANGLPVLASGAEMKTGNQLVVAEAGGSSLLATVESINSSADSLVVNFTISGTVGNMPVSGTGQTKYTANSSNQIAFLFTLDFQGQDAQGRIVRQLEEQSGFLSR